MIYVIGEALIDIIVDVEGNVLATVAGGAPLNTARTISRLGVPATFVGGISTDAFGNRIMRLLAEDGVHYAFDSQVPEPTTLAIAELDQHGGATYRFVMDKTSATAVTPDAALAVIGSDCRALHAGTLGLVLQPLADATRAVVESSPAERLVMIDPNCRPSVMESSDTFRRTLDSVLARADIVKVSSEDLEFMSPALDAQTAAQELQRDSGALVLFTDGPNSVQIIATAETVTIEVPKVKVVDTVGAGDSFGGGFLAQWLGRGLGRNDLTDLAAVVEAASFGIKVAAITCQRAGADPPRASELPAR